MLHGFLDLIFPPKCVLCRKVLEKGHMDLCPECRQAGPYFILSKKSISFVAGWTAVWYYKGKIRTSIMNYKFYRHSSYATSFGRLLAMKLLTEGQTDFDLVTWVPLSHKRRRERGFDQVQRIAVTVSKELGIPLVRTLKKPIHNPPQSTMRSASERRANVLGVYAPYKKERFAGKRILLLDDVVTTGATAGECVKTLKIHGAKDVYFAAVAATEDYKKQ